jgi:hypothetical protein
MWNVECASLSGRQGIVFFFRHLDSSRLILFIGLATSQLLRFSLIA